MLSSYGRFHRPLKSGGPTLFRPSLKVQRDGAHYLPPILLLGVLNARRSIRVRARKLDPAYLAGIGRPFGGLLRLGTPDRRRQRRGEPHGLAESKGAHARLHQGSYQRLINIKNAEHKPAHHELTDEISALQILCPNMVVTASLRGLEGSISKLGRRTTRSQPPGSGARAALLTRRGGAVPTSNSPSAPI